LNQLLAIDAGNTRLKWGVHDGGGWVRKGAMPVAEAALPGRLQDLWPAQEISNAIASNVAGDAIATAIVNALQPLEPRFIVAQPAQCGVVNQYRIPAQLGSDRWAALVAAYAMVLPGTLAPRLVIVAGTALTIDALTPDGEFTGGVIVPGPALMRAALNRGTARLPAESGGYEIFPSGTLNAIATGAVEACIGAIIRMHAHLAACSGVMPVCILSGGAAGLLAPHLEMLSFPLVFNENLVLDGLVAISTEMNSPKDD